MATAPSALNASAPLTNASANASGPSAQASVTDILGTQCKEGDFTCYKNQVSDNQIVTA